MRCAICKNKTGSIDIHHIIPQSVGGTNMPTVPLCPTCHRSLHSLIVQSMAKKPSQAKYFTDEQMLKARPLAELAIVHIRRARDDPDQNQTVTLSLKPQRRVVQLLHLLKADSGFTNMNDFCVHILKSYVVAKLNRG